MKFLTAALLFLGFSHVAQAGILIEPYLGYASSTQKVEFLDGSNADSTASGAGYGLRLGYHSPVMVWVALDASQNSGTVKYDNVATADSEGKNTLLGATIGVDLPFMFRIWGGYNFSDQVEVKDTAATNTYKGTSYKVGLGLKLIPLLSINAEYIMAKYKSATGDSFAGGATFEDVFSKFENNTLFVSVSVPFNL